MSRKRDIHLDGIQYVIDLAMWNLHGCDRTKIIRRFVRSKGKRLPYVCVVDIFTEAKKKGIHPEVLVDEGHYYEKCQMAPYRLAFAILDKFGSIDKFFDYVREVHGVAPSIRTFQEFLRGHFFWIKDARFWILYQFCRYAGIPIGHLFSPYRKMGTNRAYNALIDVVSGLKDYDVVFLAGVGKVLVQHKDDVEVIRKEIDGLLEWRAKAKDLAENVYETDESEVTDDDGELAGEQGR